MSAIMVVYMTISDSAWIAPYFEHVPKILTEYGAVSVAGSRHIQRIEGDRAVPDRMAVFRFPSLAAVDGFMADERYQAFRALRQKGAISDIFVFENAVKTGELV